MRLFTQRFWDELAALDRILTRCAQARNAALARFRASRHALSPSGQAEYWIEFCEAEQEYQAVAVRLRNFSRTTVVQHSLPASK